MTLSRRQLCMLALGRWRRRRFGQLARADARRPPQDRLGRPDPPDAIGASVGLAGRSAPTAGSRPPLSTSPLTEPMRGPAASSTIEDEGFCLHQAYFAIERQLPAGRVLLRRRRQGRRRSGARRAARPRAGPLRRSDRATSSSTCSRRNCSVQVPGRERPDGEGGEVHDADGVRGDRGSQQPAPLAVVPLRVRDPVHAHGRDRHVRASDAVEADLRPRGGLGRLGRQQRRVDAPRRVRVDLALRRRTRSRERDRRRGASRQRRRPAHGHRRDVDAHWSDGAGRRRSTRTSGSSRGRPPTGAMRTGGAWPAYATSKVSDGLSATSRAEYFRDEDGTRLGSRPRSPK